MGENKLNIDAVTPYATSNTDQDQVHVQDKRNNRERTKPRLQGGGLVPISVITCLLTCLLITDLFLLETH